MLERVTHANGVITFQSPLLRAAGVTHAFTTRIGGISTGAFSTLNFGNPGAAESAQQDSAENIADNLRRLREALSLKDDVPRAWINQVHGRRVELIEREPENEYAETLDAEIRDRFSGQLAADAIVSVVPGVLLTIRTADCVPILLSSADGRVVAAVHAGWRGVVGNIVAKSVRTLLEASGLPKAAECIAAIGPCISAEHFEVGPEVAAEFERQYLPQTVQPPTSPDAKPHIDLRAAVQIQLQRAGIQRIDSENLCTFRDADLFYSHRRDHGVTGRMLAAIIARS